MKDFIKEIDIKKDYANFWENINKFIKNNNELSPIYNDSFYQYQKEYCISKGIYIDEKSKIFIREEKLLFAYIFLITKNKNIVESNFGFDFPGLIIMNGNIDKKKLSKFLQDIEDLKTISKEIRFTIPEFKKIGKSYEEIIKNRRFSHKNILSRSINLNLSKDELWTSIRKSYKSPINKALREQKIILLDHKNPREDIFEQIQKLHFTVAGKITRSQQTWKLQLKAIKKDNGFAFASFKENTITGAIYVIKSYNNAYYAVGIFTDESKNKLYGYSLIWKAILYCKERNLSLFEIDHDINYKYNDNHDEKLVQISYFKSGFGGSLYPRHEFII